MQRRVEVNLVLVIGSPFSSYRVRGVWMIPLGLIIIAQDLSLLKALGGAFQRVAGWVIGNTGESEETRGIRPTEGLAGKWTN
jgi:hypothetical protein